MWGIHNKLIFNLPAESSSRDSAKTEDAIPANAGAFLGKVIDMVAGKSIYDYGYGQAFGGTINDFATLVATGGTAAPISELQNGVTLNGIAKVLGAGPSFVYTTVRGLISLSEHN